MIANNLLSSLLESQLDLLSTYRILQTRLGCVARQTDFARAAVIQRLDEIYQSYRDHPMCYPSSLHMAI